MRRSLLLVPALLAAPLAIAQESAVPCTGGQAAGYACVGVDLMSRLPLSTFSSPGSPASVWNNDIWGWTDPQTGKEYALVGLDNGTAFVDVSDPVNPVYLGKLPTATDPSIWRDIKVYADHAFIVSEAFSHGMQVFDLTRLRSVTSPPVTFTADARYTGNGKAHNIAINEATGFAYLVGANQGGFACNAGGLHIVDIRTPTSPTFAGCFDGDGYTHDTQCVIYHGPDTEHTGREICVSSNGDTVTITDVTNKSAPVMLSRSGYPAVGYTHQGWLTEDHRYFLLDDEADETSGLVPATRKIVFDVTDLDAPSVAFEYFGPLLTIDHNLYIRGRYAFQSNYTSGLRILDLAAIDSDVLTEVASFDTYSQGNGVSFDGQWSNYPYFASGNVIANDINNGLFVLRPTGIVLAGEPPLPAGDARLSAPTPNPTRDRARLDLTVGTAQRVRAEAFDALGRRVAVLFDGPLLAGELRPLVLDATALPAGPYLVRVTGETFATTARVSVAR